jgi:hypothetical protein
VITFTVSCYRKVAIRLAGISKILNAMKRKTTNILSGKIGSRLWRSELLYGQTVASLLILMG